ncbi:MAG: hypothetical protein IPO30_14540 [Hyphomonadaceae bacterium]|nr:hypothetical protein [Hyphomonadaceae bacterium]
MALYQIILRLARNPGFPEGDDTQGYMLVAPLDAQDRLDPVEWRLHREVCKVGRQSRRGSKANPWFPVHLREAANAIQEGFPRPR